MSTVWFPHFYVGGAQEGYYPVLFMRNFGYAPVTVCLSKDRALVEAFAQHMDNAIKAFRAPEARAEGQATDAATMTPKGRQDFSDETVIGNGFSGD